MTSRPLSLMDIECLPLYFLILWRDRATGVETAFELYPGSPPIDAWWRYDQIMLAAALTGYDNAQLKYISDSIIQRNMMPWEAQSEFKLVPLDGFDHIDLFNIPPGQASLKAYGGKLHSRRIQDLPYHHNEPVTPERRPVVKLYCGNDLTTTGDLADQFKPQLDLRERLSEQFGIDLRSKSDAQIAEAVFKSKLAFKPEPVWYPAGHRLHYKVPAHIYFQTPRLQQLAQMLQNIPFLLGANGSPLLPEELHDFRVPIGENAYTVRMGGLHSTEQRKWYLGNLEDVDVTSYYPETILRLGLFPEQIGPAFLKIYRSFKDQRVEAKRAGRKDDADTLKILINGVFGKLGSPFSIFYAPDLLLQVTITGQLALLMLIEALELNGIQCVSANTDGIVLRYTAAQRATKEAVCTWWQQVTGYGLEGTPYAAIFIRDVNSYIAFKQDGTAKTKGEFAEPVPVASSWPNPECQISVNAAIEFLRSGKPVERTVGECQDMRQFIAVRKVSGGAVFDGQELGRVARWYYAKGGGKITNTKGHQVANAEGVRPMMELSSTVPADLDHDYYVIRAKRMLMTLGVTFAGVDLN
jgi:hypothetical protein